jgi:hypothetical protein
MPLRLPWRIAAPAAGMALALTFGLVPAEASAPGWRVVQKFSAISQITSVAAGSAGDAWAAGTVCQGQCKVSHLLVSHWDGTAWQPVTPPPAKVATSSEAIAGASSASNAWVFASVGLGPRAEALHWNGTAWDSATKLRATSEMAATVVLSPTDAWAFGLVLAPSLAPYAVHYNGTGWSRVKFPINTNAASATSGSDIWATGTTFGSTQNPAVVRWTGSAWHTVALPHASLPAGATSWVPTGLAAVTPDDVWVLGVPVGSQGIVPGAVLLRWNGTAWAQVTEPLPAFQPGLLAQDGHGGVWLTAYDTTLHRFFLYHDVAGTWSRVRVPGLPGHQTQPLALSWIPGSRSLWAAGYAGGAQGKVRGLILKYGP